MAAAMNSSSESLPSSVVAKAGAFYQNDQLSSTRLHRDAVAQRATAAMGAQAMTIGNHIFLSAGTSGDESEQAAEQDGHAYATGQATAPSVTSQR
ncbi:DUF4157 domain-containing protein [Streptomyces sp. NPDC059850]|uniref:eCIS core domain-containing protein n=1 Tax=Streptomyces sp. NPDC059850 TaxID=3346970 RepID=UPI003646D42D